MRISDTRHRGCEGSRKKIAAGLGVHRCSPVLWMTSRVKPSPDLRQRAFSPVDAMYLMGSTAYGAEMLDVPDSVVRRWAVGLRDSDREVAEEMFAAFYPHLFRYARRITRDAAGAEDVVQDAFLRVWRMRLRIDPDRSLRALLFVMVRNLALNRQDRRAPNLDDVSAARGAEVDLAAAVDARRLAERLKIWIDAMPARRREAFHLSRYEHLSYAEIAGIMDVSVRTVENHIRLALQDLRDRIQEFEPNLLDE